MLLGVVFEHNFKNALKYKISFISAYECLTPFSHSSLHVLLSGDCADVRFFSGSFPGSQFQADRTLNESSFSFPGNMTYEQRMLDEIKLMKCERGGLFFFKYKVVELVTFLPDVWKHQRTFEFGAL